MRLSFLPEQLVLSSEQLVLLDTKKGFRPCGLEVTQSHWNCYHSKAGCCFLFAFYSNYGTVLYRLRDVVTYWSKVAKFLNPTVFSVPAGGGDRVGKTNFAKLFDIHKTRMIGRVVKKLYDNMLSRFHRIPERDGQADREADRIPVSVSRVI